MLSWPNYSIDDNQIVFEAEDNFGTSVLALIPVGSDKINPSGNPSIFLPEKLWGVWFANGDRTLVGTQDILPADGLSVYPNPAGEWLQAVFSVQQAGEVHWQLFNTMGTLVRTGNFQVYEGKNNSQLSLSGIGQGVYVLRIYGEEGESSVKFIKN